MPAFNVSIGFQYQVNSDTSVEANAIALQRFIEDIEDAVAVTDGLADLTRWADVRVSHGVDYDQLIRQHLDGVEEK